MQKIKRKPFKNLNQWLKRKSNDFLFLHKFHSIDKIFEIIDISKQLCYNNIMERIITEEKLTEDTFEKNIRPDSLNEYVGQSDLKEMLNVFIQTAKMRNEALDHVLLYGPPGLGKTTLASIISNEMNTNIRITSGPAIEKPGDLAALLTKFTIHLSISYLSH